MKKALFFDVDGTLIPSHNGSFDIPEDAVKEIKRLILNGHYLFVASGRPKAFISQNMIDAGFNGYVLCNGAHVEVNNEVIFEKPMKYDETKELTDLLKKYGCQFSLETSSLSYIDKKYVEFENFFRSCSIVQEMLVNDFDEEEQLARSLKIEINTDKNHDILENYIKERFHYDCHGTANSFEVYSMEITKAVGIKKVLEYLNIDLDHSYAFGDGLNDIEMLKTVGHGIAMGNALDEVKAIADEIIGDVDKNGLAEYLKTLD